MRLREEDRSRAEMIAADFRLGDGFGAADVGVAHDGEVLAERLERPQSTRRQVELPAGLSRRPEMLARAPFAAAGRAVHHLDADEPRAVERGGTDGPGPEPAGGRHPVEKRKRHGGAESAQHGPAREVLSSDERHSASPVIPTRGVWSDGLSRSRHETGCTPYDETVLADAL